MAIIGWVLFVLLTIYEWILIGRAVFSWTQVLIPSWKPRGFLVVVAEVLYTLTDPPLRFLRKLIKPLRIGQLNLDIAFIVLFFLVILCSSGAQWLIFL